MLYVSSGDGASFNWADYGQDGSPVNPCGDPPGGDAHAADVAGRRAARAELPPPATQTASLDGAILRVNPDTGAAAAGNPAIANADPQRRRIVAYGFRNPFRFTFRPGTGEIWSGDVGWNTWEEINRTPDVTQVRNYGWPCYEGTPRMGSYDSLNLNSCETLYAAGASAVTAPYYAYNHAEKVVAGETCTTGSSSVSGLAFYTGDAFPSQYKNALFFSDYSRNCIWVVYPAANGLPDFATRQTFLAGAAGPVFLTQGPDGALYYADLAGGTVRRVAADNNAPTARITATPASGVAPLTVAFSGTTSSDPEGQALTYAWDLDGDGAYDDSTAAAPSFTYTSAGTITVRLRVSDPGGLQGTTSTTITVGAPPTVTLAAPAAGTTWAVGRHGELLRQRAQQRGATLPASALRWSLSLRHCSRDDASVCHTHAIQDYVGVASGASSRPTTSTRRTCCSRSPRVTRPGWRRPRRCGWTRARRTSRVATSPTGLQLSFGSDTLVAPFSRTVIARSVNSVSAPTPQALGAASYLFGSWSDGLGATHAITAPASGTASYTATFTEQVGAPASLAGADVIGTNTLERAGRARRGLPHDRRAHGRRDVAADLPRRLQPREPADPRPLRRRGRRAGCAAGLGRARRAGGGAWNTVTLATGVPIVNGTAYWIGLLNPADSTGVLAWRDHAGGSGGAERTSQGQERCSALCPRRGRPARPTATGRCRRRRWGPAGPLPPVPAALVVAPGLAVAGGDHRGDDARRTDAVGQQRR